MDMLRNTDDLTFIKIVPSPTASFTKKISRSLSLHGDQMFSIHYLDLIKPPVIAAKQQAMLNRTCLNILRKGVK